MEQAWVFETLAVTVARTDFHDPALADDPAQRERGVRVEVRPVDAVALGSVYVSPSVHLAPAVCRVDLLESRPGAADRMHWHPVMSAGEPGDRVFEPDMPQDPVAWLGTQLAHLDRLLQRAAVLDVDRHASDVVAVAAQADQILGAVRDGLAWARAPWPEVQHDERGMART